jgi:hypothetical protein
MIVDVSRPGKWGNPFRVEHSTRGEAVRRYESYVRSNPALLEQLHELEGAELVCACGSGRRRPGDLNCHRFVLYKLLDERAN